ncbi:sec1 family domain-containing protein 2-like [Prorops nasuta]|uniref:sec1 family domain-containing protein 2-like n=1 Tax=Prorops nasuta TaxID=863751 RepID=UPI0034CE4261
MIYEKAIFQFVEGIWKDIFARVKEAAVYIDHEGIECLHWYTGDRSYLSLKKSGAIAIQELVTYNIDYPKTPNAKKALIISTCDNLDFYRHAIKSIMLNNSFEQCEIICSMVDSNAISSLDVPLDQKLNYSQLKEDIRGWMNKNIQCQQCSVDIIFKPIFIACINNNLFVTPPFSNFMPSLSNLESEQPVLKAKHFVNLLSNMFRNLNVEPDIYSVGKFSSLVADDLEKVKLTTEFNKKPACERVSLILVDRTLDLCLASRNDTQSVLSKILCTLPHLPHHSNDIAVDMSTVFTNVKFLSKLMPGCVATTETNLLNLLMYKQQRDVLLSINEILLKIIAAKESPKAKMSTRITAHSLEKLIQKCGEDSNVIMSLTKKLQISLAVVQALKSSKISQIELLTSLEKLVLQNIANSRDSSTILSQISTVIKTRQNRGLDTESLLALLIHIFALSGKQIKFPNEQLDQLKETVAEAIYEDLEYLLHNDNINNLSIYKETLLLQGVDNHNEGKKLSLMLANNIINVLQNIAKQRASLHNYCSFIKQTSPQEMAECIGILEQIVSDLIQPKKQKLLDIRGRTTSLKSSVSSFLTRKSSQSHPCDNPWIIIYVIGGVTVDEIKKIQDITSTFKSPCYISLSGSRLLTPQDIVNTILLPSIIK